MIKLYRHDLKEEDIMLLLRSDGGGEFTNKDLEDYLIKEGIKHEITSPYTPSQNGVAERKNRTIDLVFR